MRLPVGRFKPRLGPKRARIEDDAQRRQDRQRQNFRAVLPALELREGDKQSVPALVLLANPHGIRAAHAKIKHDRHCEPWLRANGPMRFESVHIVVGPGVKAVRPAFQLFHLFSRVGRDEIVLQRPGEQGRELLKAEIRRLRQICLHVSKLADMRSLHGGEGGVPEFLAVAANDGADFGEGCALASLGVVLERLESSRFIVALA
ncbi:hypothetical protein T281_03755 [Rhodomicrobium udaipurense JA643]|nr:hypothetical protein T281_03755 [Rhodomicrobium udaipurense JA643]